MAMDMPPMTLEDAQRLYDKPAYVQKGHSQNAASAKEAVKAPKNEASKARLQAILDTALGVGIKTGIAWQLGNIERVVQRDQRKLDTIYDFSYLMVRDRVVPPVISEARDLYNQDGDYALLLSGASYKIETQARFSSVPPNWRSYLTFPKPAVDRSALESALLPRDSDEQRIWRLAVADGWQQGVDQANLMFQNAYDRMNRDLTGMLRFHTFVMLGRISMPAIASESIPVTQVGATLALDETLLRITTLPQFNNEMTSWSGAITPSASGKATYKISSPAENRVKQSVAAPVPVGLRIGVESKK